MAGAAAAAAMATMAATAGAPFGMFSLKTISWKGNDRRPGALHPSACWTGCPSLPLDAAVCCS
jgi:hypothetical protein